MQWLCSLQNLAEIKAKKLEVQTARSRATEWKGAVGAIAPIPGAVPGPTKLAFR